MVATDSASQPAASAKEALTDSTHCRASHRDVVLGFLSRSEGLLHHAGVGLKAGLLALVGHDNPPRQIWQVGLPCLRPPVSLTATGSSAPPLRTHLPRLAPKQAQRGSMAAGEGPENTPLLLQGRNGNTKNNSTCVAVAEKGLVADEHS